MWTAVVIFLSILGAFAFGGVVGWVTYGMLRRAKRDSLTDIATVIGAIAGAAVTALFPTETGAFGAYCIGLAIGFFGYLSYAQRPTAPDWLGEDPYRRPASPNEPTPGSDLPPVAGTH